MISVANGWIHLAWFAWVDGKAQLFYERGKLPITYANSIVEQPSSYVLNQNFPNPFNSKTVFTYEVPVRSQVNLSIYDVLGKEVLTLVRKENAPGKYQISLDAAALSSGIYFYALRAGSYFAVKKMFLIK